MSATGPLDRLPAIDQAPLLSLAQNNSKLGHEHHFKDVLAGRGNHKDVILRLYSLMQHIQCGKVTRKLLPSFMVSYIASEKTQMYAWEKLRARGGQSPGPDGLRYNDFRYDLLWHTLRTQKEQILSGRYRRRPEKVTLQPKSSGKGHRPIVLQSILDRTIDKAAASIITVCCEPFFLPVSYGFRPGVQARDALRSALQHARKESLYTWLCVDLRDAFCHVPLPRLIDIFHKYFPNKRLLEFIKVLLTGAPVKGLRQGSPLSPVLLNLYLHHHLDKKWPKSKGQRLHRWADDILVLCTSIAEAESAYDRLRQIMQPIGMRLKETKSEAIRSLTTHSSAEWLGYSISRPVNSKSKQPWLRVGIPENAWKSLADNLMRAHTAGNSPQRADESICAWLSYYGPTFRPKVRDAIYDRLAQMARRLGFGEIEPRGVMVPEMKQLWLAWVAFRNQGKVKNETTDHDLDPPASLIFPFPFSVG